MSELKISVKENGIYVITPDALKQSCFNLSSGLTLQNFALQNFDPNTKQFITIPVRFDSQGNMEFYGVGVSRNDYTSPNADYTETNVYWLVPSTTTPQLLMSSKTASTGGNPISPMTTLHQEQNDVYWPEMLNLNGPRIDHWFWEGVSTTSVYNFSVSNYDNPLNDTSKVSVYFQAQGLSSHDVTMALSTVTYSSYSVSWSGSSNYIFSANLTGIANGQASSLQLTNNCSPSLYSIGNSCYPNGERVYFNWFELEYPGKAYNDQLIFHGNIQAGASAFSINGFSQNNVEVFDISDPQLPLRVTGYSILPVSGGYQLSFSDTLTSPTNNYIALTPAQRKTPSSGKITLVNSIDLKTVTGNYDYFIITHENFLTNIQPLVTYRGNSTGGSHSVYVAKIGDVYDSYSGGLFTPEAVKDFLSDAYSRFPLQYVLLVGDASIDYRNNLGFGQENLIPTYLIESTYGQTPSDNWFAPQSQTSLRYPLLAIGRLPAKTGTDVDAFVNKIINYETIYRPSIGDTWNKKILFVSGNGFDSESTNLLSNSAFPLTIQSITLSNSTYLSGQIAYCGQYSLPSNCTFEELVINQIDGGSLITNYLGHGSVEVWADANTGQLGTYYFQTVDAMNLTNTGHLTFVVSLECLNGMFAGPDEGKTNPVSLSESFLKANNGAVAVFSPTGQGLTSFHSPLAEALYNTIFSTGTFATGTPVPILGLAIQRAEKNLLLSTNASIQTLETVNIFVLLGDPATQLALP